MTKKLYAELLSCCTVVDGFLLFLCVVPALSAVPVAWSMMVESPAWDTLAAGCFFAILLFLAYIILLGASYSDRMHAAFDWPSYKKIHGGEPLTKTAKFVGSAVLLALMVGLAYVHAKAFAFWFGLDAPVEVLVGLHMSAKRWSSATGGVNQWFYNGVSRCALVAGWMLMAASIVLHIIMRCANRYDLIEDETVQEIR